MLSLDPVFEAISQFHSQSFEEFAKGGKGTKKGGKGGKKNCKKQQCGNSCIAVNKVCRKGVTAAGQTTGPKTKAKAATGGGGAPAAAATPPKPVETIDEMNQALKDLAEGKQVQLSAKAESDAVDWMKTVYGYGLSDLAKQTKMKKLANNLTDNESAALSLWLGSGYTNMSKQIWAQEAIPGFKPDPKILGASVLAAQALHKLPKQDADTIAERMANWSLSGETKQQALDAVNGTWNRYMTIDQPALQGFIQKYKDGKGKEIVEGNFMGITHIKEPGMSHFSAGANVVYRIKPKVDGTGPGRYVDDFKNSMKEGEILYPPGTKFRVKSIKEIKEKKTQDKASPELRKKIGDVKFYEKIYKNNPGEPLNKAYFDKYKQALEQETGVSWQQLNKQYPEPKTKAPAGWSKVFSGSGFLIELEEI